MWQNLFGPCAPPARWLPRDWESRDYPLLDENESILQWLDSNIRFLEAIANTPDNDPYMKFDADQEDESTVAYVRDAYRLVRHLKDRVRKEAPVEPKGGFRKTRCGFQEAADELKKVRDWCLAGDHEPIAPPAEPPYKLEPPNKFCWAEGPCVELPPIPWRMLEYLLEHHTAEEQDVVDHVWGHNAHRSTSAIKTAVSDLANRLARSGIPVTVSRKQGFIILSIDPP